MSLRHALSFLLLLAVTAAPAIGQTRVELPDLTAQAAGSSIQIPVHLVTPLEASDNVTSYSIEVSFDPNVLTINDIEDAGTLTEGWTAVPGSPEAGIFIVNALNPDQSSPLVASSGPLFFLDVTLDSGGGSSPLQLVDFNFTDEPVETTSGTVSVGNALVITEIHADPDAQNGDANGDGTVDDGDLFVEIVNTGSSALSLDGYELVDGSGVVLATVASVTLNPEEAVVVFGGGTPAGDIPSTVRVSEDLSLPSTGGTVALRDAGGARVDGATYGPEGNEGQSVTRAPGLTDAFARHTTTSSGELFSPGRTPDGNPLPVELEMFDVRLDGTDVLLRWTTLSETDNHGFGVQHRAGTESFRELRFVPGAGTTTRAHRYTVRLGNLGPGQHAFRLRQVDGDGAATFTKTVSLLVAPSAAVVVEPAGPNPFRRSTALRVSVRETQDVSVGLYNVLGQQVRQLYRGSVSSSSPLRLVVDGTGLASGLYVYRVDAATGHFSGRLVRIR